MPPKLPKDKGRGRARGVERGVLSVASSDFKEVIGARQLHSVALEALHEQSQAAQPPACQPQPTRVQDSDVDTDAASVTSKTSVASMVLSLIHI